MSVEAGELCEDPLAVAAFASELLAGIPTYARRQRPQRSKRRTDSRAPYVKLQP